MELTILNKKEIDDFLWENKKDYCVSIKGDPPDGATYSDGDLIKHKVNVGWRNTRTGATINILYEGG